jgi:hypothetical protein
MYTQIQKGLPQMVWGVLAAPGATAMSATVGHGALILALAQPVQSAAAGSIVEFTGTITNTGPQTLGLIDVRFTPPVDPPALESGIPLVLLAWQKRVECIEQLIDAGFVNQLFLSNDWVFGDIARDQVNRDGLLYTTRKTIPFLKQIGVSQQAIHAVTVENPRRFFSRR